jgi:CRISPR/Cas system CMR-associated protein Cmr3 (group 5 of RAMP superfamily)
MLKTKDKGALGDPNLVELILYEDGNIAFSHDLAEQFTYLYNDQVKKLLKILKKEEAVGVRVSKEETRA